MIYRNAQDLQKDCQENFARYVNEGLAHHPELKPSHLCVRSNTPTDFATLSAYGKELGVVGTTYKGDMTITWVHLNQPLHYGSFKVNFLEITSPKWNDEANDYYQTGPQMLIFAKEDFGQERKEKASDGRAFVFRYQSKSAEQILGF